jgi:hypothetical protein
MPRVRTGFWEFVRRFRRGAFGSELAIRGV